MPYREKTAWLMLAAMAVTFGPYFTIVATGYFPERPLPDLHQLGLYAIAAIVQVVILGAGHLYLRHGSPDEARMPPDERDLAIMRRSMTMAYYVLIMGMILVGVIMSFTAVGWKIVNAALFTIFVGEIVHYGSIVLSYRSQT